MRGRIALLVLTWALLCAPLLQAVVIDRIDIVVGNAIIKESDINRNVRVTEFLNNAPLNLSAAARKQAANRLIDQTFIRNEIRVGDYPIATFDQADKQLNQLMRERFHAEATLESALARYGLNVYDLRFQFRDQLTDLNFIALRFKPAAYVSDDELQAYYKAHETALKRQHPTKNTLDDLRPQITNTIQQGKVNTLFFAWLDDQRKTTRVNYLEESLR